MTSTSFGTQTPSLPQSLLAPPCENTTQRQLFDAQNQAMPGGEGAEAQRVRNFSGQYTFKAPAADDFAKGMQSYRATAVPTTTMQTPAGTTSGLINAIKALLGGSRSGALSPREPD